MTSIDNFSAILQNNKLKFGTPYFVYLTKNLNLIATVEDIMQGQYNFHAIIFAYQDHFSVLLEKHVES